jgi:hypothetical protein
VSCGEHTDTDGESPFERRLLTASVAVVAEPMRAASWQKAFSRGEEEKNEERIEEDGVKNFQSERAASEAGSRAVDGRVIGLAALQAWFGLQPPREIQDVSVDSLLETDHLREQSIVQRRPAPI